MIFLLTRAPENPVPLGQGYTEFTNFLCLLRNGGILDIDLICPVEQLRYPQHNLVVLWKNNTGQESEKDTIHFMQDNFNPKIRSIEVVLPDMAENKEVKTKEKTEKSDFNIDVEEMAQAGVHFGHRTSRLNPKMTPYIYGVRNTVHIIDLEKTAEKFKEALKFIQKLIKEDKTLLLVGTKIQIKHLVKEIAAECDLPYVNERWLGGTFTNFEVIKKRIDYFKDLEKKRTEGEFEKYTKKERIDIDHELERLKTFFGGIRNLNKLPDAVFVIDMKKDSLTIKEARMKEIPVIGVSDTNADPTLADYPIPANDDAISSVRYILGKVKEVILKTKPKA